MSTLFITLIIAFILVVLSISALSIGWLVSGKSRIVRGACGMDPTKTKQVDCGDKNTCGICEQTGSKTTSK